MQKEKKRRVNIKPSETGGNWAPLYPSRARGKVPVGDRGDYMSTGCRFLGHKLEVGKGCGNKGCGGVRGVQQQAGLG